MRVALSLRHLAFYPLTAAALAVLLLIPAIQIGHHGVPLSRHRRDLKHLLQALSRKADLVLSHDIQADRSAPEIWIQRLGAEQAADRWSALRGQIWWTAWVGDGAPVLIVPRPSAARSAADRSPAAEPEALLVFAVVRGCLSEKVFREQPLEMKGVPSLLETVCLDRLMSTRAVRWRPAALSSLAGASSVLLQSASHGCLSLSLRGKDLRFSGFVSPRPLASAPDG